VLVLAACGRNAENEHLPTYCQTYAGFSATASRDLFDLLDESGYALNRFNYLSVISEIELSFERDEPNEFVDLSGIQCFQNLTSLTLIGRSFKDLSPIRALSNIQSIELRNTSVVSIDSFQSLSKINNLVISETKTLQNVEGVGEMTKLTTLDLSNNGLVNIGELNALVNLEHLYLDHNEIVYFPSINNLVRLRTLDISHNNIIELGEDLSGLSNLVELQASNNQICDISTLDDLTSIQVLDLSFNNLGCGGAGVSPDFDSLESATNLRVLKLNDNNLSSIEDLRGRSLPLEVLYLHNNEISDLTPIADYMSIQELSLYNNSIALIDDLSGMVELTAIDLSDNNITDFSPLRLIEGLRNINLSGNAIVAIPDLSDAWPDLEVLDLHSNLLMDVSGVEGHPNLRELILYNNGLTTLRGIRNLPELERLVIVDAAIETAIPLAERNPNLISTIVDSFEAVPSLSLHTDHVLDLGFPFGENVEIRNSFIDIITVHTVDWDDEDIVLIDADSMRFPNLAILDLSDNFLSDLSFLQNNPNLVEAYLDNNPITDLSIFQSVDTEAFDDLQALSLQGIPATGLFDAFVDLPSLEVLDLSDVPLETIEDSLQNLPFLEELYLYTTELRLIDSSFHDLFLNGDGSVMISILTGRIGTIRDSFHRGSYGLIEIRNQEPITPTPTIENSFHDLEIPGGTVAVIQSDFQSVSDSFLRITGGTINLEQNGLESITNSFIGSDVESLNLSDNRLSDLPSLNQITALELLELGNNALTTVAFIDGITGLSTLWFYEQTDDFGQPSLLVLDGINNQPDLTAFTGDLRGITSITGFQNSGFAVLDLSAITIESTITNIGPDAFAGTPIQTLDLSGHQISDVTFLANLNEVEELSLGLDVLDLSGFLAQPMALTLTNLTIGNRSLLHDFAPLSTYDVLTDLTITTSIQDLNNLDGMDELQSLTLALSVAVETITDSFNDLPALNLPPDYLELFPNLTTITGSFDLYGPTEEILIPSGMSVNDSFHMVGAVILSHAEGGLVPQFDPLSFTNMTTLEMVYAEYASYAFLNSYTSLTTVMIETLSSNITDLSSATLSDLTVVSASNNVDTILATMSAAGRIELTTSRTGTFDLSSNASSITLYAANATVTMDLEAIILQIESSTRDLTVNASDLTTLVWEGFVAENVILNTPELTNLSRLGVTGTGAQSIRIESDASILDVLMDSDTLLLDTPFLQSGTLNVVEGTVQILDGASQLSLSVDATSMQVTYDTLEQLTLLTGTLNDLTIDSDAFDTLIAPSVSIDQVDVISLVSDMTVVTEAALVTLDGINLTTVDARLGGSDLIVNTTQPTLTLADTSNMNNLDLSASTQLATIVFGEAAIEFVTIDTTSPTVSMQSTQPLLIHLDAASMHTLDVDAQAATLQVNDADDTLTMDATLTQFSLNAPNVTSLTLAPSSDVNSLFVLVSSTLNQLWTNDSSIDSLTIATTSTTLQLDATNATTTSVSASALTNLTMDTGANDATINAGVSNLTVNAVSGQLTINGTMDTITLLDTTTLDRLTISSGNLASLSTGAAVVTELVLPVASANLSVSGSAISVADIQGAIATLHVTLPSTADLSVVSTADTAVDVTTTTSSLDITTEATTTISGGSLMDVIVSSAGQSVDIEFEGLATSATIDGTAASLLISGLDVDTLSVVPGSVFGELELDGLDLTTLDLSGTEITTLTMTHPGTSLSLTAPTVDTIALTASVLTDLTLTTNATTTLSTTAASLTMTGSAAEVVYQNDNLLTLDLSGFTVETLTISSTSLAALDTHDAITSQVFLQVDQDNFALTSDAPSIDMDTDPTYSWSLTSSLAGPMSVVTNASNLDLSTPSSTVILSGANLSEITGTSEELRFSGFATVVLTLDVTANTVRVLDPGSLISILGSGTGTIGTFLVEDTGNLTLLDTNDVTVTTLDVFVSTTLPLSIVTSASDVQLGGAALGGITEATLTYEGADPLDIVFDGLGDAILNLTGTTLTTSGTVTNLTVNAPSLTTFSTTGLLIANRLTLDDSPLTTLAFADPTMLASLSRLEMNTLSNADMGTLLDTLDGTTLTLVSPIVTADIYDYYYTPEYDALVAQELIDNVRYDNIRATAIDDSWDAFLANQYLDHLDETTIRNAIDTDTLQTVEDYFQSYLDDAGLLEGDLAPGEDLIIRNAIQVTLDQVEGWMDEASLQAEVTDSIETDAAAFATTATAAITFTIE
jgi:Leucine-rich repeat (LRR) protein